MKLLSLEVKLKTISDIQYYSYPAIDGNKRKIDESGEDRAAKNPRHNLIEAPQPDYNVDKSTPDQFEPTPLEELPDVDLEPPQFDLIVLGLSYKVEEDEMRRYFEQFGELQNVEVMKWVLFIFQLVK